VLRVLLKFPVLLIATSLSAAAFARVPAVQTPLPIPATPGVAVGTVKAGARSVTLAHAYASGPIDDFGEPVYQIVLTDSPVPPEALDRELRRFGGAPLLRAGKLSGIIMTVGQNRIARVMVPFIGPDLRGSAMLSSVPLTTFTVQGGRVTGQGARAVGDTMGQGWSYSASWNATLRPPAK